MYVTFTGNIQAWRGDDDESSVLYDLNTDDTVESWNDTQRHISGTMSIAAAATESVSMGDIAAGTALMLLSTGDMLVSLNGDDQRAVSLRGTGTSARERMLSTEDITSVSIENPGASAIRVDFIIVGDVA